MTDEEKTIIMKECDKQFRGVFYNSLFGKNGELHNMEPQIDKVYVISTNNQIFYAGVDVELFVSLGIYPKDRSRGFHRIFYISLYSKDDFEKVCREQQLEIATTEPTYCIEFDMTGLENNMPDTYEQYLDYRKLIEL